MADRPTTFARRDCANTSGLSSSTIPATRRSPSQPAQAPACRQLIGLAGDWPLPVGPGHRLAALLAPGRPMHGRLPACRGRRCYRRHLLDLEQHSRFAHGIPTATRRSRLDLLPRDQRRLIFLLTPGRRHHYVLHAAASHGVPRWPLAHTTDGPTSDSRQVLWAAAPTSPIPNPQAPNAASCQTKAQAAGIIRISRRTSGQAG